MDNYSSNLVGFIKAADDMSAREALEKITPYLEDASNSVDAAGEDAMNKLPKVEDLKASVPGALGALTGYGAGGAGGGWLASLLSKKISGKRSLPAIIASVLGGGVLGGIGGRHAGEAIGEAVKSASMEKQAASLASGVRKYIQALRNGRASSVPVAESIDPSILKSFIPDLSKAKQVKIPSPFAKNTPASFKLDDWNAGKGIDL